MDLIAELAPRGGAAHRHAGGGVTPRNVGRSCATGAREVHVHIATLVDGPMRYRNPHCFMGGALRPAEFGRSVTTADDVRALRAAFG